MSGLEAFFVASKNSSTKTSTKATGLRDAPYSSYRPAGLNRARQCAINVHRGRNVCIFKTALHAFQGTRERMVRSGFVTRKRLLEAQLHDTMNSYSEKFRMPSADVPKSLSTEYNKQLDKAIARGIGEMNNIMLPWLRRGFM